MIEFFVSSSHILQPSHFSNWNEMKEKLEAKEITREEYEDFKKTYESGTWTNTPDGKSPWTGK